ncbi:MAG: ribbon-helix-helix domain-containing protein [Acetobacteraceae bacterium]
MVKRSFSLAGHRTSVALEPEFWAALQRLAEDRGQALSAFVAIVDSERTPDRPLASALRVTALLAADATQAIVTLDPTDTPGEPSDTGAA